MPANQPAPTGVIPGLVSIVMPVFNGEEYLRQAIDSALAQTYPEWELLVIDDGSTDQTAQIVAGYTDARLRYTYQANQGQAAALNHGLRLARGEFVTTLDADDWLPLTSLADRVQVFRQHPEYDVVYGDGLYVKESGEPLLPFTQQMPSGAQGDVYDLLIVSPFYGTGAAVLVRRKLLEESAIAYDEQIVWCQDWDIYIRLAETARFGFSAASAINYRMHNQGMTITMPSARRLESLIRLRHKVLASPRFAAVDPAQKAAFFYDFLVKDLHGRPVDQSRTLAAPGFLSLPADQQARLARLTALSYLFEDQHSHLTRQFLGEALRRKPTDPKTLLGFALVHINLRLARKVIGNYQVSQSQSAQKSPFEIAAS